LGRAAISGRSVRRRTTYRISALRRAFELGIKVVDTSELYGRGRAEMLVGDSRRWVQRLVYSN